MALATNDQTWWDAICNVNENSYNLMTDPKILNEKQYEFYRSLRNNLDSGHPPATYDMNTEEQFMYICFMAAFHNYK